MSQEETISINRATVVGPGLLGASIAMAMWKKGIVQEIWTYLRDEKKREVCQNSTWCDQAMTNLNEAVTQSDLVILCTPVETILNLIPKLSEWVKPGCIVTDVGSLKKEICQIGNEWFADKDSYFIGSHPMTGSEKEGMNFASADLLEQKNCIVTPTKNENLQSCNLVTSFWEKLGMKVVQMDAEKHDEIVGWISHLPHITATCIINSIVKKNQQWMDWSGSGLKDTTRIASGNPEMWKQILSGNRENLIRGIEQLVEQLGEVKQTLQKNNNKELNDFLEKAKFARDLLNE